MSVYRAALPTELALQDPAFKGRNLSRGVSPYATKSGDIKSPRCMPGPIQNSWFESVYRAALPTELALQDPAFKARWGELVEQGGSNHDSRPAGGIYPAA
jgi:hypothetical protein